jgi:rifampin ADP-ribosylating transferase
MVDDEPSIGEADPLQDAHNIGEQELLPPVSDSYRSHDPLRVMGEVNDWVGHSPERLKQMKDHLERLKAQGVEAID